MNSSQINQIGSSGIIHFREFQKMIERRYRLCQNFSEMKFIIWRFGFYDSMVNF